MQVVFHIGAHCTDEDRLLKCLLKNKARLREEGIAVPGPSRFRGVIRESLHSLKGRPAPADMQEVMLDALIDDDEAGRIVLSRQGFLAAPEKAIEMNMFYAEAGEKTAALANLFPQAECEFFLGLRNPATFVPALFQRSEDKDFARFVTGLDPHLLRWSEMVGRIRSAVPRAGLTVWCNEDTPLLWPELLRELSGHDPFTELDGTYDFLASIMTKPGMKRMRSYLETHPPQTEIQRRRIVAAFLDKFAIEDEVEMELDLPGWTAELVDSLTEAYEEDMFAIEQMPGVHFITP